MARGVWIKIRSFEAYKGRKDVVHNSWFRCSNRLLEDPDFFGFSHTEILVWIYILSLVSQKNADTVFVNFDHAERVCRPKVKDVKSALEKLTGNQIDPVDDTPTLRARNADDTQTCATDRQTDKQTGPSPSADASDTLSVIWNENRGGLPELQKITKKRRSLANSEFQKYPKTDHWIAVLTRWKASEFCTTVWRPNFDDWLNENKRIATLEGRYDNRLRAVAGDGLSAGGWKERDGV